MIVIPKDLSTLIFVLIIALATTIISYLLYLKANGSIGRDMAGCDYLNAEMDYRLFAGFAIIFWIWFAILLIDTGWIRNIIETFITYSKGEIILFRDW